MRPGMDWNNLRIFLAVAAAGSLAGAARRTGVSQATVWRRVKALERSLDTALFERRPEGYALGPAGSALFKSLEGVHRTIESAGRDLAKEIDPTEGEVRITAPEFAGQMVGAAFPALAKRHPRLLLEVLTGSPAASLMAREVDIALKVERGDASGFVLEGVFPVRFGVYASPDYLKRFGAPRAIDELKGHRLVDFDRSWAHVAPRPWQKSGGRGATVTFRTNSPHARLAAVRAGAGLGMLPEPLARLNPGLRLVLPDQVVGSLELMMYVSAARRRELRVVAVRDFLNELFSARGGA